MDCSDADERQCILEALSDWILWVHDFNRAEYILNTSPEQADMMRVRFGIDDDYRTIPPDPNECDLPAIRATLNQLCGKRMTFQQRPRCSSAFRMIRRTFCESMLKADIPHYNLRLELRYCSRNCDLVVTDRKPDDSACGHGCILCVCRRT